MKLNYKPVYIKDLEIKRKLEIMRILWNKRSIEEVLREILKDYEVDLEPKLEEVDEFKIEDGDSN